MTYLFLLFIIKQNILKDCNFFNNNCKIKKVKKFGHPEDSFGENFKSNMTAAINFSK
jgi:hypothetical protein